MSRIAVVYWSGTGNTQRMAEAAAEGARSAGAVLVCDSVTCSERPDDEALTSCQALGAARAG